MQSCMDVWFTCICRDCHVQRSVKAYSVRTSNTAYVMCIVFILLIALLALIQYLITLMLIYGGSTPHQTIEMHISSDIYNNSSTLKNIIHRGSLSVQLTFDCQWKPLITKCKKCEGSAAREQTNMKNGRSTQTCKSITYFSTHSPVQLHWSDLVLGAVAQKRLRNRCQHHVWKALSSTLEAMVMWTQIPHLSKS